MKHAYVVREAGSLASDQGVAFELPNGAKMCLAECEYGPDELKRFNEEAPAWIVQCRGSGQFLAKSESGEDARGAYCCHFDLDPSKAVFEDGRLVGFYLSYDGMRYSGNGRYDFEIDDWGYPGKDLFGYQASWFENHLFLVDEPQTHAWNDWSLLRRDPTARYDSYLDF